jgi:hypothetical protein
LLDLISRQPPIIVAPAKILVDKHLMQLAKLHVQMSNLHPAAFALLPNSLELCRAYWGLIKQFGDSYGSSTVDFSSKALASDHDLKEDRDILEKLTVKGLTLLRSCLKMVFSPTQSFKFRTPEVKEEQKQAVALLSSQMLTEDMVREMANVIVTKFFVFRQADLAAWEEVTFNNPRILG